MVSEDEEYKKLVEAKVSAQSLHSFSLLYFPPFECSIALFSTVCFGEHYGTRMIVIRSQRSTLFS